MTMLNEHLEHHITQKILSNEDLSSRQIEVKANNGQVILTGEVQSFRKKLAAEKVAADDANVDSVINQLVVGSPDVVDDATIGSRVNQKFDNSDELAGDSIRVSCNAGSVSLTGYVDSELKKLRAADMAASVAGVREVANYLIANPDQVASNQTHCRKILASMLETIGMEDADIRLSVVNETARLSGEVDAIWKKESAQTIVSQFGILNVVNDIVVRHNDAS